MIAALDEHPRPGQRHVHLRRAPGRPAPVAGDRDCARWSRAVLARGSPGASSRRAALGRPAGEARLQRPARDVQPGHVDPPVRPAGQPGRLPASPRTASTRTTAPTRTSSAWSPTSAAAPPTCHQGWPKFATHLWMRSATGASPPSPTRHAPSSATAWRCDVSGGYPFEDDVTISGPRLGRRTAPDLRIPAWAPGALASTARSRRGHPGHRPRGTSVTGSGRAARRTTAPAGARSRRLPPRRRDRRRTRAVGLLPGLTGGLAADRRRRAARHLGGPPDRAVELRSRSTRRHPARARRCRRAPLHDGAAPLHVKGRLVPDWTLEHGAAAAPPPSPVTTTGASEDLTLIPYGCTISASPNCP